MADIGKCVGLCISYGVDYSDIAEIDSKIRKCREECEFSSVEVGLACDETAYVVAHNRGECFWRKHYVADYDYSDEEYADNR